METLEIDYLYGQTPRQMVHCDVVSWELQDKCLFVKKNNKSYRYLTRYLLSFTVREA